jgi:hypothetical protein
MKSSKVRRFIATAMAAVMMFGSALNVSAAPSTGPTTVSGNGSSTGHVNRTILNMQWPTYNNEFDYVFDAERLIKEAGKYKAATVDFAEGVSDNGVYFNNNSKFDKSSAGLEVVNKSSVSVDVTVKAVPTVSEGSTMVAFASTKDALATEKTTPTMYMALSISGDEVVMTADEGAEKTKTISGCAANFELTSNADGSFTYAAKATVDDTLWQKTTVSLNGAGNTVENASGYTAPKITVTWSYKKTGMTSAVAYGNWSDGTLWLGKNSSTGFSSSSLTVEASVDGVDFVELSSSQFSINDAKWVSTNWANIQTALGGSSVESFKAIRITDGNTEYTYVQ